MLCWELISLKKRLLTLLLCLFLLCPYALAHGGKTDANGGHYDRSTGEYHYHHGYPAHQHYDMDGDGIIDCPYDFDDQTDHSSHGGSSQSRSDSSQDAQSTPRPSPQKSDDSKAKHISTGEIVVLAIFAPIAIPLALLYASIYIVEPIHALIDWIKNRHSKK